MFCKLTDSQRKQKEEHAMLASAEKVFVQARENGGDPPLNLITREESKFRLICRSKSSPLMVLGFSLCHLSLALESIVGG
uniref:Uncharacterized protein n=1 Tax=Noccaea caerulescens TaxID=107243 RepID=A0A1J3G120_NOCCA